MISIYIERRLGWLKNIQKLLMKNRFAYLIIFFMSAVLFNAAERHDAFSDEDHAGGFVMETVTSSTFISDTDSDFCPPRQISSINSVRLSSTSRRVLGSQRHNLEFVKAGKLINTGIRYFIQKSFINVHSSVTGQAHRLASLGRLII